MAHDQPLSPRDLVGTGRLGVTVKKSPVVASVSAAGKPFYTTMAWEGVS